MERHPDNILISGIMIARIESSILYFNAENILEKINRRLGSATAEIKLLILDLSAASYVDVAGSKMLLNLAIALRQEGKKMRIVHALSNVREILRKQGLEEIVGPISRSATITGAVTEFKGE